MVEINNLIVPMVCKCSDKMPLEFQYNDNGEMKCIEALSEMSLLTFDNIYFALPWEGDIRWDLQDKLTISVERLRRDMRIREDTKVHYVVLTATSSQAETIYQTIKARKIQGSIFIKDADNKFTIKTTPTDNSVCLFSLEYCDIVDPTHKSYVTLDDNMFVTNMIEKRVVSSYFNCGGYSFKDVNDFIEGYKFCKKFENNEHMYLSHIIYYLILFKKMIFKPVMAESYTDFAIENLF